MTPSGAKKKPKVAAFKRLEQWDKVARRVSLKLSALKTLACDDQKAELKPDESTGLYPILNTLGRDLKNLANEIQASTRKRTR